MPTWNSLSPRIQAAYRSALAPGAAPPRAVQDNTNASFGGGTAPRVTAPNGNGVFSGQTGLQTVLDNPDDVRKEFLLNQAGAAGDFADQQQAVFNVNQAQQQSALAQLQNLAAGNQSISAEQLRQSAQQNQAQQQSIAASAAPQNATAAARTAAIQAGRIGAGLAGQQAQAGLQERNQATSAFTNALGNFSGQSLNAALSSRGNAITGAGAGAQGQPDQNFIQKYGPAIIGAIGAAASVSDARAKTNLTDGTAQANAAVDKLATAPVTFQYKPGFAAAGPPGNPTQLGITTQALTRAGLGSAVRTAPGGTQVVDGANLAAKNTALIAALGQRVKELEQPGSTAKPVGKPVTLEVGDPEPSTLPPSRPPKPVTLEVGTPFPTPPKRGGTVTLEVGTPTTIDPKARAARLAGLRAGLSAGLATGQR